MHLVPISLALVALSAAPAIAEGLDYNSCRKSMAGYELTRSLVENLVEGLLPAVSNEAGWNINDTFRAKSVNLLFPSREAAATWNAEACGGEASLARCWSWPNMRVVVCNPGFADWLAHANYFSPPLRPEVALAGRFMVQTILGHEIGHLERNSAGIKRHMAKNGSALSCAGAAADDNSEENQCDARGAELACPPARASEFWRLFIKSKGGQVSIGDAFQLMGTIRRELQDFSPLDDACTGANGYRSFSMRRRLLSRQLTDCLIKTRSNPFMDALIAEEKNFLELEAQLTRRQDFAAYSDPENRLHGTQAVESVGTDTFLVSGYGAEGGEVSLLMRDRSTMRLRQLGTHLPGRIVGLKASDEQSVDVIFRRSAGSSKGDGGNVLSTSRVTCAHGFGQIDDCTLSPVVSGVRFGDDTVPAYGRDGSVLLAAPKKMAILSRAAGGKQIASRPPAFSQSEVKLVASRDQRLGVAMQFERSGLYVLELATPEGERSRTLSLDQSCRIYDLSFRNDILGFLMTCDDASRGEVLRLLECPTDEILDRSRQSDIRLTRCKTIDIPALVSPELALFDETLVLAPELHPAPPGCRSGVVVSQMGWSWLRRSDGPSVKLPAERILRCDAARNLVIGYRAGKIVYLAVSDFDP